MATRTLLRTVFLTEPWPRPSPCNRRTSFSLPSSMTTHRNSRISIPSGCGISRARDFHFARRTTNPLNCSHNETPPPPPSSSSADDHDQGPPQEAVLKAISEVSKAEGRVGQTTNLVIGGTVTDDSTNEWLVLDQKVNSYPTVRGFTAIGSGGDDFVQSMVVAVESVLQQPIPEGQVKHRESSRGNFVSVKIGPVRVISGEQVQAVYNAMRRDDRMKFFL